MVPQLVVEASPPIGSYSQYYFSQLLVESQLECGWFFPSKVGIGNIHISILVTAWLLIAWQDDRSMRQDVSDMYVVGQLSLRTCHHVLALAALDKNLSMVC